MNSYLVGFAGFTLGLGGIILAYYLWTRRSAVCNAVGPIVAALLVLSLKTLHWSPGPLILSFILGAFLAPLICVRMPHRQ